MWDKMKLPVSASCAFVEIIRAAFAFAAARASNATEIDDSLNPAVIRSVQVWLLNPVAYGAEVVGKCFGTTFKLNLFNVRVLTMHRWFNISAAERDLQYRVRLLFLFCF